MTTKELVMREPREIKVSRGGPGSGWANPDADHHVYEYLWDEDPEAFGWRQGVRPKSRKLFVTRRGAPALIPESGTHDQLNAVQDQFTLGVIEVGGVIYTITEDGPEETEKPNMSMTPYVLVLEPEPKLLPDGTTVKGKSYRIATREDLEELTQEQLLTLFKVVLPKDRHGSYTFPNKTTAVDYVWNVWLLLITALTGRPRPSHSPVRDQVAKPVGRTVRKKDTESGDMANKVLTRTPVGIGARRKEGTRRTESWNVITDGMTFGEYIKAGGNAEDLNIIIRLGHVTLGTS
jgi:hypothetical protein